MCPPTFSSRVELPDRVEHAEAILFSARRLVVQLCGWLSAQQLALTHASVTLEHERGREAIEPTTIDLALAEPTWHEEHLVRLLKERLGRIELQATVIAVRLNATKVQAAEPPTDTLFPDPGGSTEDHNRLLELLVARLGPENVLRPAPTSYHRPEHANRWVSVQEAAKPEAPPCDLPRPDVAARIAPASDGQKPPAILWIDAYARLDGRAHRGRLVRRRSGCARLLRRRSRRQQLLLDLPRAAERDLGRSALVPPRPLWMT